MIETTTAQLCICERCGHEWKTIKESPQRCPKCKVRTWRGLATRGRPRKQKKMRLSTVRQPIPLTIPKPTRRPL